MKYLVSVCDLYYKTNDTVEISSYASYHVDDEHGINSLKKYLIDYWDISVSTPREIK